MIRSTLFAAFLAVLALPVAAQGPKPQLWYWNHSLLTSPQALASSEALIDRAAAAGYTGVAFWDVSSEFINSSFWPAGNTAYFQQALNYAKSKGMQVMVTAAPFGYSNDVLENNPSWAEAQRVVGTQFQVDPSGTSLQVLNSFPGLANPGFESGQVDWFSIGDPGVGVDTTVAHTGFASAVINNAPANARLKQNFSLQPWRQYHVRLFYKSQNFQGYSMLAVFDAANFSIVRLNPTINAYGTQDWTELDYTFNSQDTTQASMYLGVWGGNSGTLWFDDIQIEETDLVYVTRGRAGTPLRVYDPNNPTTVFQEGTDYNYISDPQMTALTPFTDTYHTPPTVTLPAGTHLSPGQVVAIDSYDVFPIPGVLSVNMCFTEPGVLNWVKQNAQALAGVLPQGGSVLLGYDEIRQMNSCLSCKAKNMTPGQLLAWSTGQSLSIYQSAMPSSPLYVWNDMFDPYHNAVKNYYYVEGDISGSWSGLPANVTVLNWNLGNLTNSLNWFSGANPSQPVAHQQIIAGYYDSGNGTSAAQSELAEASGIPGVVGLMYTTWGDDYSQLENFASAAQSTWNNYLSSLSASSGVVGSVQIIAKSSGACLDVRDKSLIELAQVQQWSCGGGANQLWQLMPVGDGSFEVISLNSGMSLSVAWSSLDNGGLIIQWPYLDAPAQHWTVTPTSDGFYNFIAQGSGKCLDVTGGPAATANGVPIQQWGCGSGDNQKWKMVPLP